MIQYIILISYTLIWCKWMFTVGDQWTVSTRRSTSQSTSFSFVPPFLTLKTTFIRVFFSVYPWMYKLPPQLLPLFYVILWNKVSVVYHVLGRPLTWCYHRKPLFFKLLLVLVQLVKTSVVLRKWRIVSGRPKVKKTFTFAVEILLSSCPHNKKWR